MPKYQENRHYQKHFRQQDHLALWQEKLFSLIELLIVVAIIAILAALLLPALNSARNRTKQIQCISNLNQLGKAIAMYNLDHQGFFPSNGNNSPRENFFGSLPDSQLQGYL